MCLCVSVCVCQVCVEELPAQNVVMGNLNSRLKQITFPADKQKDIRIINTRWSQVSFFHYTHSGQHAAAQERHQLNNTQRL